MRTKAQTDSDQKYRKRRNLELLHLEHNFTESGKWKTDGCWCGAEPTKIEYRRSYTDMSFSHLYLVKEYLCLNCKRRFEIKREVK